MSLMFRYMISKSGNDMIHNPQKILWRNSKPNFEQQHYSDNPDNSKNHDRQSKNFEVKFGI